MTLGAAPPPVEIHGGTARVRLEDIFWERKHRKQLKFVFGSARRYQLFLGGRGAGKSWALLLKALILSMANPNADGAVFGRTLTKDVAAKLFPLFMAHCATFKRKTGIQLVQGHDKASWITTMRNGARIHWLSYGRIDQLEKNRGYDLAWAVLDEAENAQVDPAYAMVVIDDAVRSPAATHFELAIATTPNGLRGAVGVFLRAQSNGSEDHFVVHATSMDNPFLDQEQIAKRRRGRSTRLAKQEIDAIVLRPANVVMAEFKKRKHVVPYTVHEGLLWVVGIDWGTTKGHIVAAQVDDHGRWTVFAEDRVDQVTRPQFRQRVEKFIAKWWERIGDPPHLIAADRAISEENAWLRSRFGSHCLGGVTTCESLQEQAVLRGIGYIQFMLDPADGSPLRLQFSDDLTQSLDSGELGIVGAMTGYRYRTILVDGVAQPTNSPMKDQIHDDPIDSLRYAVTMSRLIPELHGGGPLPCVETGSYRLAA